MSCILDLKPPTKTNATPLVTEPQHYTNNYRAISFYSPVGWLIQSPPKTDPNVPDLVVLGPQTSTSSPALSLTIDGTSGTLANEILKLQDKISPLITQNVLTITDEGQTSIDDNPAYILRATGKFENLNDQVREVGFSTIVFVNDNRVYTIQYTNHLTDYYNYEDEITDLIQSFKLIHSGPPPSEDSEEVTSSNEEGGGCLIATAAFGSEMAPQIQFLREIRDNTVMTTQSGTAFMTGFNQFYYSFSPYVADYERENPLFKEAVKLAITPMISTLSLMENAESESEVLSIGISVIMLNLGMYLAVPAIVIVGIKKRF